MKKDLQEVRELNFVDEMEMFSAEKLKIENALEHCKNEENQLLTSDSRSNTEGKDTRPPPLPSRRDLVRKSMSLEAQLELFDNQLKKAVESENFEEAEKIKEEQKIKANLALTQYLLFQWQIWLLMQNHLKNMFQK